MCYFYIETNKYNFRFNSNCILIFNKVNLLLKKSTLFDIHVNKFFNLVNVLRYLLLNIPPIIRIIR